MEKSNLFHQTGEYESRKDLLIHYLNILHNNNKPISFSDLLLSNLPGGGINEFESVMSELESKKWIIKIEKDGGAVPGLPFHRTIDRSYSISLEGVEYLASLKIIDDKYMINENNKTNNITNYGNMVVGDNQTKINQSSGEDKNQLNQYSEVGDRKSKNILNKIYKWTDHKLISMILFALLGFLISRLLTWLEWI
ncbi:hypothetical protein [Marinifilum fragile]|uniref:hypothetical protein n=1 Tax=Marinifilum fragile TaxID=570161 RepID=UPI002AA81204|nr:hypothetical protein [Marinifilum fragile]